MFNRRWLLALAIVGLTSTPSEAQVQDAPETPLPPPPDGYAWKRLPEIRGAFLLPHGWHLREEYQEGTRGYLLSAEDISTRGSYEVGLGIWYKRLARSTNAVESAEMMAKEMLSVHDGISSRPMGEGVVRGWVVQARMRDASKPLHRVHMITIGNERTNALYLILFESPEATWDEAWAKGGAMLRNFLLDDEM